MRRNSFVPLLLAAGLLVILLWSLRPGVHDKDHSTRSGGSSRPASAPEVRAGVEIPPFPPPHEVTTPVEPAVSSSSSLVPQQIPDESPPAGPRELRAYRMILDQGKISLAAVEDIRGDFRQRRGPVSKLPGMFCCQLLNPAGAVLAEETMAAPDLTCVVLDPHLPASDGRPQAVRMTSDEPQVFQSRLPKTPGAATLRVVRLGAEPSQSATGGTVLASFPLSP